MKQYEGLKKENEELEVRVDAYKKELSFMTSVYDAHAAQGQCLEAGNPEIGAILGEERAKRASQKIWGQTGGQAGEPGEDRQVVPKKYE